MKDATIKVLDLVLRSLSLIPLFSSSLLISFESDLTLSRQGHTEFGRKGFVEGGGDDLRNLNVDERFRVKNAR